MQNHSGYPTLRSLRRTVFLISMPFFVLGLILPVYGKEIGASVVEIGLFFTAFSIVTVLLRPLVGWGLDHFGRRGFFLTGVAGYAITMVSYAFINQVWGVILARVCQGVASSFLWLSASAITADCAGEDERGKAFGHITQAGSQGGIVGTFIGLTILLSDYTLDFQGLHLNSWMLLFLIYGLVNCFALLMAARQLPETRPVSHGERIEPIHWSRAWILLLLVTLVTGASAAMLAPILIIFLQDKLSIGIETLAWAFLPTGLVSALLPAYLGRLADRFGRKPMMVLGLIAAAATSFIVPGLGNIFGLTVVWAFQALCYAAGDPAEQALVADLTGVQQRGRAYGLYVMCADLGAAIGPLGGAWLYQTINPQAPFIANGIILAGCAAVLWIFLKMPDMKSAVEVEEDQPA
ncbi:MAG TPA: MFS transporter [Anaerolineaceae bacterium]|nr:MFS transporter [Anaerolineaceae bacterium]HPN51991.1 MFS transporter [Anaerolineaceae bacterium]